MQIYIRAQDVLISDALVAHCVDRAQRVFQPMGSRITHAEFTFAAVSGMERGLDHACRVTVDLSDGGQVHYEGCAGDFHRSASRAIEAVARNIQNRLSRRRGHADMHSVAPPPAP